MGNAKPETVYLYLMGMEGGPSKVGYASCTQRRLKQLQAREKGKLIVLGTWPVAARKAHNVERYVHWLLRDQHYRGEWFHACISEVEAAVTHALASPTETIDLIPTVQRREGNLQYAEHVMTRLPAGTSAKIVACCEEGEGRADFIRSPAASAPVPIRKPIEGRGTRGTDRGRPAGREGTHGADRRLP